MKFAIARIGARSLGALVVLFVGAWSGVSAAATLDPVVRAAARDQPVEVFVWLRPSSAAASEPSRRAFAGRQRRRFRAAMAGGGAEITHEFRSLPAVVLRVDAEGLDAVAADPEVQAVSAMQYGGAALADSVPQIGATEVHQRGFRGEGAVLGLLDTGIDATHPDIAGRVDGEECLCAGCCPGRTDRASGPSAAQSTSDHGPHVAGIMISGGVVAAEGVAPAAHLLAVRVLNDENRGRLVDWLEGLDLILSDHPEVSAVNMSLVSDAQYPPGCEEADAFAMAFADVVRRLRLRGTLVVAAAGNSADERNPSTIGVLPLPACLSDVVAVGAVTKQDAIASFSNVATGLDLLAPGVAIVSDAPGGGTAMNSGTSMASPHVAGAMALLLPLVSRPFLAALPGVLRANGVPITDKRFCPQGSCQSFPRLDVAAATDWLESINLLHCGGGSRALDCQAEWSVYSPKGTTSPRGNYFRCRDGDATCDTEAVPGSCTFRVRACFNVPDRRLVTCDPLQTLTAYRLLKPSLTAPHDEVELGNAIRVLGSLPSLPIRESGQCGDEFDFVVQAGTGRSLRLATESLRGHDIDRLRFVCLASE